MNTSTRRRRMMTGLTLVVLAGVAVAPGRVAAGQQPAPGDDLRIVAVDSSSFPDVVATVAVPQRARNANDPSVSLTVTSAGSAVPTTVERLPANSETVAVLLDTATGTYQPTMVAELGAAAEFIRQLDPATPIVVGTSTAGVIFGPRADPAGALAVLGRIAVDGEQNWSQTLAATLAVIGSGAPATIVVVSATAPTVQHPSPVGLLTNLSDNAVSVRWLSLEDDARPNGDLTGIQSVTSTSADGLLVRLDSIAAELTAQYRLTFKVDPRATAATITLAAGGATFTAATPLPVPSPAFVPPPTTAPPQVASAPPVPSPAFVPPTATAPPQVASAPPIPTSQQGSAATLPGTTVAPVADGEVPGINASTPARPQHVEGPASVTHRVRNFLATNWPLLTAGAVALVMLAALLSVVTDRSTAANPRRA